MNKPAWISPHKVLQLLLINTVYHLLVNNNKGEGKLIRGGAHLRRGGLSREFTVYNLRKIQELFQPDIARKIRIFSLDRKNNILNITKRVYRSRTYLSITPCATSSKTSSCLQSWSKTLLNLNVQKTIYIKLFHYFYYKLIHNIVTWN